MGPEVLPGSNQGPKGFSIPTLYFLQRSYLKILDPLLSLKTTNLLQTSRTTVLGPIKANDIRAFVASKAFLVGSFGGPNHASLSLESSQYIDQFYL